MVVKFRARRKVRADLDMTPFMDMAIQLIIFFMLTTNFASSTAASISVDLPSASSASVAKESEELLVTVDRNDHVLIDKKAVGFAELERIFRGAAVKGGRPDVVISADKLASHGTVVQVMDTARQTGLDRFSIAVQKDVKKNGSL